MIALFGNWVAAGGDPDSFWRMTPRMTDAVFRARNQRDAALAWHVAALTRIEKMPDLDELTGGTPRPAPQSRVVMAHNLRLWKDALALQARKAAPA